MHRLPRAQAETPDPASLLTFLLSVATLPAWRLLLQPGFFSSSDGMIHLYRLFELDRALHAGIFYPRWFPLSGYGYGLPVLNYYPPLAYYFAELFHLAGADYIGSIKWLIAAGFIFAAWSMFIFARELLGDAPAFVAGIAYAYLPYLLSDAYVRGNFAEFMAMSILPLALFAFRRLFSTGEKIYAGLGALTFAAIILTHHLTAMLFAALLGAYVVFLSIQPRDWKRLWLGVAAIFSALALSAFYWLPAMSELDLVYVGSASLARFLVNRLVSPADFLTPSLAYTYLPQSEALLHSAGFPQTMLALASIVIVSGAWRHRLGVNASPRTPQHASLRHGIFFFLVVLLSILMMLSISAPLWYALPPLHFLQFPWRFQVLAGIGIAFLIGVWAKWAVDIARAIPSWIIYAALGLSLIALSIANLPDRAFALSDADLNLLRSNDSDYVVTQMGWGWTREYVPASVQESDSIYASAPHPRASAADPLRSLPSVQIQNDGLLSRSLRVSAEHAFELSTHTFFYPGWQAYIDGAPARAYPRGTLGLTTVAVPSGDHEISFRFQDTPLRTAANGIALLALGAGFVWLFVASRRAAIGAMAAIIFVAAIFVWHTRDHSETPQPIAVAADLEHQAMLIGYATDRTNYRAGDTIYLTLYWLALQEMAQDSMSFVHLTGAKGEILAQHDGPTDQGLTPTTRWLPGEIVTDHHAIALNANLSGEFLLTAGLYLPREDGWTSLTVYDRSGKKLGDQVELGRVQVNR